MQCTTHFSSYILKVVKCWLGEDWPRHLVTSALFYVRWWQFSWQCWSGSWVLSVLFRTWARGGGCCIILNTIYLLFTLREEVFCPIIVTCRHRESTTGKKQVKIKIRGHFHNTIYRIAFGFVNFDYFDLLSTKNWSMNQINKNTFIFKSYMY